MSFLQFVGIACLFIALLTEPILTVLAIAVYFVWEHLGKGALLFLGAYLLLFVIYKVGRAVLRVVEERREQLQETASTASTQESSDILFDENGTSFRFTKVKRAYFRQLRQSR